MIIFIWFAGFICTCALHRYMVLDKWFAEDNHFYVMSFVMWPILSVLLLWAILFKTKPVTLLPFILS